MSHALPRALLLAVVAIAALPASVSIVAAQTSSRLGIVTTLVGDATLTRAGGTPRALAFKDEVFPGDTIRTAPGGLARVLMRGATLVAIGDASTVGLTAAAARSTVRLDAGTVSVVVGGDKPVPLDIRTPQALASLRGTSVIAQIAGAATTFYVLTGLLEVQTVAASGGAGGAGGGLVLVKALETTTVSNGQIGAVGALTPQAAANIMKDFRLVPAHPDPPAETVKTLGERGQSEIEKEAKALRDQGARGLPKAGDTGRPVVPIQPDIRPTQTPKACC